MFKIEDRVNDILNTWFLQGVEPGYQAAGRVTEPHMVLTASRATHRTMACRGSLVSQEVPGRTTFNPSLSPHSLQ